MTLQQRAANAIQIMPEDKLQVLMKFADFLNKSGNVKIEEPSPTFFTAIVSNPVNTEKKGIRFGLGKDIITNVDKFDSYNVEIARMFEEALK